MHILAYPILLVNLAQHSDKVLSCLLVSYLDNPLNHQDPPGNVRFFVPSCNAFNMSLPYGFSNSVELI